MWAANCKMPATCYKNERSTFSDYCTLLNLEHMRMPVSFQPYLEIINGKEVIINSNIELQGFGGNQSMVKIMRHSILKFGRNEKECNLICLDPAISSVHCIFWNILFEEDSVPLCYIKDCSLNGTYLNGSLLKRNVAYLLNEKDVIEVNDENQISFRFTVDPKAENHSLIEQLGFERSVGPWKITSRVVGNGTFGHVFVANKDESCKEDDFLNLCPEHYAVKIIKLKPNKLNKEAKILVRLDHPNIIKVHDTYCDLNNNLYIFQDLIQGGDLFSYLAKGDCLTSIPETEALIIVYQILHALRYLHDQGIVHRDLKLDNILLCSPESCTRIVLADFGIAKDLTTLNKRMHTIVGTPEYCAPEVGFKADRNAYQSFSRAATLEQKGYDNKCDLWSLGVITHIMLTGISPFYADATESNIIQTYKKSKLSFTAKQWNSVTETARKFVQSLLTYDANKRLDSKQSLLHPWISKHYDQLEEIYVKKILNTFKGSIPQSITHISDICWKRKLPANVLVDCSMTDKKKRRKEL